jgi:hypothetical protein
MRSALFPAGWALFVGLLGAALLGPANGPARAAAAADQAPPEQAPATAPAQTPISLELNKLAPLTEGTTGCRAYFVVANPGAEPVPELQLDLILFGTDGIISRRLAVEVGPLPAEKTVVRLFDLSGTPCDSIGHILLNDVLSCQVGTAASSSDPRAACLTRIAVSSRAKAPLTR